MVDTLQRRFISMFDTAVEGLWIMTEDERISYYNAEFYRQFPVNLENSTLSDWIALVHPHDRTQQGTLFEVYQRVGAFQALRAIGSRVVYQYRVRRHDGSYCWLEAVGEMKQDENGCYIVGNHRDITLRKKLESSIRRLAYEDKLSGLPNHEQLKLDLTERGPGTALVHIHLDRMKSHINQFGDEVLREVVRRFRQSLSVFDGYVTRSYRCSKETFNVTISGGVEEEQLGQLCQAFINRFAEHSLQGEVMYAEGVYIGACICPDPRKAVGTLINAAAQTCEYAYRHEACRWAICNTEVKQKVERHFYIERKLRTAIESDNISVRFQPIVCAESGMITSFEALARWENSELGEIYPDEFIPTAERKGLIGALGARMLVQASSFISYYNARWGSNVRVNVNISALQILAADFPLMAKQIVIDEGAQPENVVLELTESVLLDDKQRAGDCIRQLQQVGFRLAMDDFGSGHSSIISFFKLPFHQLKIDKELIYNSLTESRPFAYLVNLTALCREHNIEVTLEGIEDRDMQRQLQATKASTLQGYLFSRPVTLEQAMQCNPCNKLLTD